MTAKRLILYTALGVISAGVVGRLAIAVYLPGATVTSWWRSPAKNRQEGGRPWSRHLVGLAYDVIPVTRENEARLRRLFPWADVVNEGDHIHSELIR